MLISGFVSEALWVLCSGVLLLRLYHVELKMICLSLVFASIPPAHFSGADPTGPFPGGSSLIAIKDARA